jgi:hypothetical protein
LRAKRQAAFTRHSKASAVRTANSTAVRFDHRQRPRHALADGHVWLLGAAPNVVEQPQNIFGARGELRRGPRGR